ncbi:sugar transferase [Dorea sp.]
MKKIPFAVVKMLNIILLLIPFIACWGLYYEPRTSTVGSKQVTVLVLLTFFFLCYWFCQRLDCFRVSILQIRDIIFGQVIALMVTDAIMYILIWMLSIHLPNILPGLVAWVVQCIVGGIWAVVMHKSYFSNHPPLKTIVIYDERVGMENLIHTYGLQKRFRIKGTFAIEEIIDHLDKIDNMDAVFLCGIHSTQRNIILKYCTFKGIKLFMIPRISDVMMRGSEQIHMLHLPIMKNQRYKPSAEYIVTKRALDIIISGVALVILSPIILITAIVVKSDGGPAFYKQKRLTKDGKVFEIIKFRSMRVDAEKFSGAVLSSGENDPRITKVGRVIRACRLDELPQLFNILKGDMSLVGPRPERPELQKEIEKEVPEFGLRLQTKAGLTGYAQVYGKYNTTFYDKLLMDLMYISNPSILEDLTIMLATVKILTSKESTEGVGEGKEELKFRKDNKNV